MLTITKYLTQEQTEANLTLTSSKRVLEHLSTLLAKPLSLDQHHSDIIFEKLLKREKLGSTSIGHGVSIPRAKYDQLTDPIVAMITLDKGIDFDAEDTKPVDIFVGLLVPDSEAHQPLAKSLVSGLTTILTNQKFCISLRESKDNKTLYNTFLLEAVVG